MASQLWNAVLVWGSHLSSITLVKRPLLIKSLSSYSISNKVSADNIHISRELVQDFKASRMKYDLYLEEKKEKEKEKTAKENQKSIIKTEIKNQCYFYRMNTLKR